MEFIREHDVLISFTVGCIIVLQFCFTFFNSPNYHFEEQEHSEDGDPTQYLEPTLPKYMTSRKLYNLFLTSFVTCTLGIYIALVYLLSSLEGKAQEKAAGVTADGLTLLAKSGLSPLAYDCFLAALIIAGVAPNTIGIRKVLVKLRTWMHLKAQIPVSGQEMYGQLKSHVLSYKDDLIGEALGDQEFFSAEPGNGSARADLERDDFEAHPGTVEGKWAKASYLVAAVKRWSQKSNYHRNLKQSDMKWQAIARTYQKLSDDMVKHRSSKISKTDTVVLNTRLDALLRRLYRAISCLLFMSERSERNIHPRLQEIGLTSAIEHPLSVRWTQVLYVAFGIAAAVVLANFAYLLLAQLFQGAGWLPGSSEITTGAIAQLTYYSVPFHLSAVLCVVIFKAVLSRHGEIWPAVNPWSAPIGFTRRPWHIYLLIALVAHLASAVILALLQIPTGLLQWQNLGDLSELQPTLYWSSLSLVTALFVAYRIDSLSLSAATPSPLHRWARRIGRGSVQGACSAGVTYFVYMHLHNEGSLSWKDLEWRSLSTSLSEGGMERPAELFLFLILTFLVGVAINMTARFWQIEDRRGAERIAAHDQPAELTLADGITSSTCQVLDFAPGGMKVTEVGQITPVGMSVTARIDIPGADIPPLEGLVVGREEQQIRIQFAAEAEQLQQQIDGLITHFKAQAPAEEAAA